MATKENLAKRREERMNRSDTIRPQESDSIKPGGFPRYRMTEEQKKAQLRNKNARIIAGKGGQTTALVDTPQIQPVVPSASKEETTQQGVPAMPSKKVATSTPPASPSTQEQVVKVPKESSVLTPEQSAAERNRMVAEVAEPLAQQGKENLQRLNLAQINEMTAEASARGQAKLEAEREAEEKRQRRNALLNAIGDGVAAMTNLYFTSKGAPNVAYDPRNSLSARSQARYDKINAERRADEEKAYLRRQNDLKSQIEEERQRKAEERQAERDRIADERYKEEKERQERWRKEDKAEREAQRKADAELVKAKFISQSSGSGGSKNGKPVLVASGETIYVPEAYLDDHDVIAEMYEALPESIKQKAFEEYNLGKYTDKEQLSNAQMNDIVSRYRSHPDAIGVEKVLRRLAGMKPTADEIIDYNPDEEVIDYVPNK